MQNDTSILIDFLNSLANSQDDIDKINQIKKIYGFRQSMDIVNGENYLLQVTSEQSIKKYLKIRPIQYNYDINGKQISKEWSFIQDCNAVIDAIAKSLLEDKIKDEYKKQVRPEFKNLLDIVEFYKNIINY